MSDSPAAPGRDADHHARAAAVGGETQATRLARENKLVELRDAGLLTDFELEEQKEKLRWGIAPRTK